MKEKTFLNRVLDGFLKLLGVAGGSSLSLIIFSYLYCYFKISLVFTLLFIIVGIVIGWKNPKKYFLFIVPLLHTDSEADSQANSETDMYTSTPNKKFNNFLLGVIGIFYLIASLILMFVLIKNIFYNENDFNGVLKFTAIFHLIYIIAVFYIIKKDTYIEF